MQDYASQIHDLFEDDSFPPIVVFSGKWGIGKTFYVQNHLTPELVQKYNKKVHYLSLMGITSIEDFKDLLVSKVYLEEKHDKTATTKLFDVFKAVEKHIGGNTTISSVIKGSTGAAKHYMLKNIDDEIFIIDDIERLEDESLKKAILGECLTLSEKSEDKKNRFLIVTDIDALNIELSFREKIISEVISFEPNAENIFDIIKPNSAGLENKRQYVISQINSTELFNLRVLSRLFKRIGVFIDNLPSDMNFDLEIIISKIIETSFNVAKLYYSENKSINEIIEVEEERNSKLGYSFISIKPFVSYLSGSSLSTDSILDTQNFPMKNSALDRLIYQYPHMLEESDFNKGIKELKSYILNEKKVYLSKFFNCCNYHEYLVQNGFIKYDQRIVFENIDAIAQEKEFIDSSYSLNFNFTDRKLKNLAESYLNSWADINHKRTLGDIYNSVKKSFKHSQLNDNASYKHRPILHEFSSKQWSYIFEQWEPSEFGFFAEYLLERYRLNTTSSVFEKEKDILISMQELITNKLKREPIGLKRGNLSHLSTALAETTLKLII